MNPSDIKHILVIRFRRVGDSVLATALCSSLKRTFPHAQIHFVVNQGIHELYENHPDIDHLVVFNNRENQHFPTYVKKVWRTVHDTKFDVIIDMRSTVRTLLFSLFSLHTPFRIGRRKGYTRGVLNYRLDNLADKSKDRVEHNLMLMEPLAAVAPLQLTRKFSLYVSDEHRLRMRTYMEQQGIDFKKTVLMATPTARLIYKVWPMERMVEVLRRIIDTYDAQIIFNYAGSEREQVQAYREALNNDAHIFTNIEAPSLPDLCAVLVNCDFFFGNEGGPRHMAQALDVPSYAIYPPGIWKSEWLPAASERFVGISPDDFLSYAEQTAQGMDYAQRFSLVTPDRVWKELNPMLAHFIGKKL